MKNFTVAMKLGLGFGLVLVLTAIMGIFSLTQMNSINQQSTDMASNWMPSITVTEELNTNTSDFRIAELKHVIAETPEDMKDAEKAMADITATIKANQAKYEKLISSPEEKAGYDNFVKLWGEYMNHNEQAIPLSREMKTKEAMAILNGDSQKAFDEASGQLLKQVEINVKGGHDASTAGDVAYALSQKSVIGFIIVAILIGVAIAFFITRELVKQLGGEPGQAAEIANKIAAGDLSSKIEIRAGDSSSLLYSMNVMQRNLTLIVGEIRQIVTAANKGDFNTKMDLNGKAGYTKELSDLLNQLSDTVDGAFKDTIRVADALARGDLSQKVTTEYQGAYNQVKISVNTTADSLTRIVGDIRDIVALANKGDFSTKIGLEGKAGYTRELSNLLNQLSDTVDIAFKDTIHVAQALAKGDLTQVVTRDYQGAFNDVKQNLNDTVSNLKNLVNEVKVSVDSIGIASKEIASGNSDLSQRTEEQASSLEETASSMEELTSTVRQNASNAEQANQLAHSASSVAEKGGAVVQEVVGTMSSINESSRKIVDIISVIDGIAFQTNILALNAAVEAARAGEQGRGFAVVAAEVRNLAQRSAAAAKEIKTLIGDSVEKVEVGTKLVDDAGKTMEEIVSAVKRVTNIMSEISAASAEQSQGIEQVNQAISQMDEVTQQNAALVEEAAAAAESLEEEAQNLTHSVSVFKMDGGTSVQQTRVAETATRVATKPAAKHPAARHPAIPAKKAATSAAKAKALPAKASKADEGEWEEF